MNGPIETKVTAATAGAAVAGALTVLIMNLLAKEPVDQTALQTVIAAVVTGAVTFVSGFWAKHTNRPDLPGYPVEPRPEPPPPGL